MKLLPTDLPGVVVVEPKVFEDPRGFFMETWNERTFRDATNITLPFVQDNHSRSAKGVLRGLHYQVQCPQGKLVRVVRGAVFDVAVDIRRGSTTFGQWVGVELSGENHRQLWLPPGMAHGFLQDRAINGIILHKRGIGQNQPKERPEATDRVGRPGCVRPAGSSLLFNYLR